MLTPPSFASAAFATRSVSLPLLFLARFRPRLAVLLPLLFAGASLMRAVQPQISAGGYTSLFLAPDGTASMVGIFNRESTAPSSALSYAPKALLTDIKAIASGTDHNLFLRSNGSVWTFGGNLWGQLGNGTMDEHLAAPVQLMTGVTAIAANFAHSLFLKTDGSAWAAGGNYYGTLGDGTTTDRWTPVRIMGDVIAIAAGDSHSVFLKSNGVVYACGSNLIGNLGDGTNIDRLVPVPVMSDVVTISAGGAHSLFLKSDGSAWKTGIGTKNVPLQVMTEVSGISAGGLHDLFLKADGTAWALGQNWSGQLGDGTTTTRNTPVQIMSDVIAISAGERYSLFLKADGSVYACGDNSYGVFGDGTSNKSLTPIKTGLSLLGAQSITFSAPPSKTLDTAPFALSASSSSGLPVSFQVVSGPAMLEAGGITLTLTGQTGTVVIKASQSGGLRNGTPYAAASSVQQSFTVTKVPQTISFAQSLPTLGIDAEPFALTATASSGLPVAYLVTGPASVENGQLIPGGHTGVVSITATQPGNATYGAANQITRSFTIKAPTLSQTITFNPPATRLLGSGPLVLVASSSSALPVTLELLSGGGVLAEDNRTLTLLDTGAVRIRATQKGNIDYLPASTIERVIIVPGKAQKITFAAPPALTYGDANVPLVAIASSSLPVSFELVSGPAKITEGGLVCTGAGHIVVRAVQQGGSGFGPAAPVTRTITVNKAKLAVSFEPASRLVGRPSPVFIAKYTGFVNGDTEDDLASTRPAGVTTAKLASAEGDYPISFKGGIDANYRFVAGAPAFLTVLGFGGAYEGLLVRDGVPVGKLELTISKNSLAFTGTLTLASETKAIPLVGTLVAADNLSSATGAFSRNADGAAALDLSFTIEKPGSLSGSLERNGEAFATVDSGQIIFVPTKTDPARGVGAYTMVLRPPTLAEGDDQKSIPRGSGHAAGTIDSMGRLKLGGKLADGVPFTATLLPGLGGTFGEGAQYRLFAKPYGKRHESSLGGAFNLFPHEDSTRFPGRLRFRSEALMYHLVWQKAETPAKPLDASCRDGFAPHVVEFTFDPWIAPAGKPALSHGATIPAGTLVQRIKLGDTVTSTATVDINLVLPEGLDFGARATFLPASLNLSANGAFSVPAPLPAKADNPAFALKVTPASGAFAGSFTLSDLPAGKTKLVSRKVTISGTLRQGPDGATTLGHGHFLLDPSVEDTDTEQVSGELILSAP